MRLRRWATRLLPTLMVVALALSPLVAWAEPTATAGASAGEGLRVESVSLGDYSGAAVMEDGSLWTWGMNSSGQLGDGTTTDRYAPVKVIDSGVRSVSMGDEHAAAVMEDGSLWTWGRNASGELGDGTTEDRYAPVKVIDSGVRSASMGYARSLAVMEDGSLWTWGNYGTGSLGDGTMSNRLSPAKVIDSGVKSASMKWASAAAVMEDGSLLMWGSNYTGQIGDGTTVHRYTPLKVIGSGVVSVAAGSWKTAAVMEDGSLWTWGGDTTSGSTPTMFIESDVRSVALDSGNHVAAVMEDGSLWMWGDNRYGQLGDGTTEGHSDPVEVISSDVRSAAVSSWASAAVLDDGSLWTWGQNYNGALGDGTTEDRLVPTMIFGGGGPSDTPTGPVLPASDTLTQLAACLLSNFNVGSGFEGKTVGDCLGSGAFVDRAIWDGAQQTYGDLFSQVLGGYEIVSARVFSYKGAPHIALRNPASGDVIVAFSEGGPELLESVGVPTYFNDAAETLEGIEADYPSADVYLTGANVGGMAASYLSTATRQKASTFNSPALTSTLLTALTQSTTLSKTNAFRGVNDTNCVNYYADGLGERFGYDRDILVSSCVDPNPLGESGDLTALLEYADGAFRMRDSAFEVPSVMQMFAILNRGAVSEALSETFAPSLLDIAKFGITHDGRDLIGFPSATTLGDVASIVTLGTTGHDSMRIGIFSGDKSVDLVNHYVNLTGVADSDYMEGGSTSDVFVMGDGGATFNGRAGSDIYYVGDNADVTIHDTGATDGNNLIDLFSSSFELVSPLGFPALPDFAESLSDVLSHTNRDAIVFTSCSFDDMDVTYDDAGDCFIIQAGTSRVTVPNRSQDFYVVDASGKTVADGMTLNDLFAQKRGVTADAVGLLANESVDYSKYVSFYIDGENAAVRLVDASTGEELRTISVVGAEGMSDVCLDYGTFVVDGTNETIDGLYDSSRVRVDIVGDCDRVITNRVVGYVEGDLAVSEDVLVSGFDGGKVEIRADEEVTLVGSKGGSDAVVPSVVVEDVATGDSAPDSPDAPDTPVPPTGGVGGSGSSGQVFAPVVPEVEHGSVTVVPDRPHEGDEVAISPKPDEGFVVGSVTVTDGDGGAVEVADNGDGTWSFTQPACGVTVAVRFTCDGGELCPSRHLVDVAVGSWYHDAVDWAVTTGLMGGYGDGSSAFGPGDVLTRGQLAQMLWNQAGRPEADPEKVGRYVDCSADAFYARAVVWCSGQGYFMGYDPEHFGPDDAMTREQLATVLWRMAGSPNSDLDLSGFLGGDQVSDFARTAMRWAVEGGVIRGQGTDGSLDPAGWLGRAQAAVMFHRLSQSE